MTSPALLIYLILSKKLVWQTYLSYALSPLQGEEGKSIHPYYMKLTALGQAYKENICPYFKMNDQYKKRSSPATTTLLVTYYGLIP